MSDVKQSRVGSKSIEKIPKHEQIPKQELKVQEDLNV